MTTNMRKILNTYQFIRALGFDLKSITCTFMGLPRFFNDLRRILKQQKSSDIFFPVTEINPRLGDRYAKLIAVSKHYFLQDLYIAQKIYENKPLKHVDVGSRIDGFVAHVASFRNIEVFDIRTIAINNCNIRFRQCDLMSKIDPLYINYCDSLSCLHALEHFGLGRYGDKILYDGYLKGYKNLSKMLKKNGKLYLSVPIGPQRIVFNAHRIFSIQYILELFKGMYNLDSFSYIDDLGKLHVNVSVEDKAKLSQNLDCSYGCGIFELTRL